LAREKYIIIEAEARELVKKTGMDFADAFAQVKSKLGAETREAKSSATLGPEEQLATWRAQMTPEERTNAVLHILKSRDLVTSIRGRRGQVKQALAWRAGIRAFRPSEASYAGSAELLSSWRAVVGTEALRG
jgi:hypothetical protein